MLAFYNISKKIRGEFEKKLEDLSRESKWVSIRAISVAFIVLVSRELLVSHNTQNYENMPSYVSALPWVLLILVFLFLLSIKALRELVNKYIFDFDEVKFVSKKEKKTRLTQTLKSIRSEMEYLLALSSLTASKKAANISYLVEENMAEIFDKIEETESSSHFLLSKDAEAAEYLVENRKRFKNLVSTLENKGVQFSASFKARTQMS